MPGVDQIPYLTNTSILELDYVPPRLVIVGGSYVGLEFGQMFRRFGSEVTIIEKGGRLVPAKTKTSPPPSRGSLRMRASRFALMLTVSASHARAATSLRR